MQLDVVVFNSINGWAGRSLFLDYTGIFLAEYLPYVLGLLLFIWLWYPAQKRDARRIMVIISLISALIARLVVKTLILLVYTRQRPYTLDFSAHKLIATFSYENIQSFPSGHTLFFFALGTSLYLFNKKIGFWFLIAATFIGIARIFVGVHWPSDVLGGIVGGVFTGFIVYKVYKKYQFPIDQAIKNTFAKIN